MGGEPFPTTLNEATLCLSSDDENNPLKSGKKRHWKVFPTGEKKRGQPANYRRGGGEIVFYNRIKGGGGGPMQRKKRESGRTLASGGGK